MDSINETPEIKTTPEPQVESEEISFDEFLKVKLKVGQIVEAEKIEKSNKLVKLKVDLGEEKERQIVAGISKHYEPTELIAKKVVVVANLKPAKLMGELSEGMILAASDDSGVLELVSPGLELKPGSKVS